MFCNWFYVIFNIMKKKNLTTTTEQLDVKIGLIILYFRNLCHRFFLVMFKPLCLYITSLRVFLFYFFIFILRCVLQMAAIILCLTLGLEEYWKTPPVETTVDDFNRVKYQPKPSLAWPLTSDMWPPIPATSDNLMRLQLKLEIYYLKSTILIIIIIEENPFRN